MMRKQAGHFIVWLLVLFCAASCVQPFPKDDQISQPNSVVFKRTYRDTFPADQTRLYGWLKKPAGEGPFPAVIMLIDKELRAPGDREWEERLVGWGYVVLHVDSMGSRAIDLYDHGAERNNPNLYWHQHESRAHDAIDAKNYLKSLPYVHPRKIAVMGWGYGGTALFYGVLEGHDPFQAAISFYPASSWPENYYSGYEAMPRKLKGFNAPVMILVAEGPSNYYGNNTRAGMTPARENLHEVQVNIYPVAYPGFDLSGERYVKMYFWSDNDHYFIADYKFDREAGTDARARVKDFLAKYLQKDGHGVTQ